MIYTLQDEILFISLYIYKSREMSKGERVYVDATVKEGEHVRIKGNEGRVNCGELWGE